MSVSGSRARLATITKDLIGRWKNVKERWRDGKATEFEKAYLEELIASVNTAVGSLEKLDHILTEIRKDCE